MNRKGSGGPRGRSAGCSRTLHGMFAVIAACATAAWSLAAFGTGRPVEATLRMEQLTARIEHADSIHPDTVHELTRMLALPQYDCSRTACDAGLQARNRAVRLRLEALIATTTRSGVFAVSGGDVKASGPAELIDRR
jgi:hypothetical protein